MFGLDAGDDLALVVDTARKLAEAELVPNLREAEAARDDRAKHAPVRGALTRAESTRGGVIGRVGDQNQRFVVEIAHRASLCRASGAQRPTRRPVGAALC